MLEAALRQGWREVEELLRRSVESDYPFVTGTSRHLVDAGGKRYRPLLALLCAAARRRRRRRGCCRPRSWSS